MNKETTPELFLLDTHIWIWLINGDPKAGSPAFLKLIRQEVNRLSRIRVSVISVWEVGMLEQKRRIILPFSVLEWVQKALRAPGISLASLTPEIAIESTRLLGEFHGDPADRILVATAKSLGATLVTQDSNILSYSKKHALNVISP